MRKNVVKREQVGPMLQGKAVFEMKSNWQERASRTQHPGKTGGSKCQRPELAGAQGVHRHRKVSKVGA